MGMPPVVNIPNIAEVIRTRNELFLLSLPKLNEQDLVVAQLQGLIIAAVVGIEVITTFFARQTQTALYVWFRSAPF